MRLRNIPHADDTIKNHSLVIQYPAYHKNKWSEVFGNDNPIHIEIGTGKGRFILALAKAHPDINFIGIERYSSILLRALERRDFADVQQLTSEAFDTADLPDKVAVATEEKLENVRFICMDAAAIWDIFGKNEVSKIYLNFSDPWPKARHEKRRLTSKEFLRRYEKVLIPDGKLEFKTDNVGLFEFSLHEIERSEWILESATYDLHKDAALNEGNIMTEYEQKFSSMGKPICKLIGIRRPSK
ncbi:MAG: tRNA (guanosine(46)-N7)-methyltransferase TrmB [Lachnospiraceae bacterium]|nr:tRNA (guanosine(46)-N7)-methyltransferase TrmB [Lachnospiraceae bacterium]